jgi:hypothetical protein
MTECVIGVKVIGRVKGQTSASGDLSRCSSLLFYGGPTALFILGSLTRSLLP